MESLNLNTLASSLPNAQQKAEKDLTNDFKAAALSITTLYRSSRRAAKRAYNSGYAAACQDLLTMIQQGVSAGGLGQDSTNAGSEAGMSIGRIMDWTEARLEEIKAREEEEDEEEEKERVRPASVIASKGDVKTKSSSVALPTSRIKENVRTLYNALGLVSYGMTYNQTMQLPQTPDSPSQSPSLSEPPSPSPPPVSIPASRIPPRSSKHRLPSKTDNVNSILPVTPSSSFTFRPETLASLTPSPDTPIPIVAGAKRRHMMMMMDSAVPTISIDATSGNTSSPSTITNIVTGRNVIPQGNVARRRTRSSRTLAHPQPPLQVQNVNAIPQTDAMEVEEDGRERKRVARR
ncbi:hypothetical protein AX16_006353 [Volvariella volvacea WC 439]|nr:hypothetical protein AX16_006353 [Volvariella volvacea WC 439]